MLAPAVDTQIKQFLKSGVQVYELTFRGQSET